MHFQKFDKLLEVHINLHLRFVYCSTSFSSLLILS